MSEMTELAERLKDACHGHPHAKIPWPHRILHEAAAAIERLDHECQASMATIASERARAVAAEAREKRLREALKPFTRLSAWHGVSVTAGEIHAACAALESKDE